MARSARVAIGGESLYDPEPYVLDQLKLGRSKGHELGLIEVIISQYLELIKGSLSSANGIESCFDVIPICRPFLLLLLLAAVVL